ncbi:hypothetical protein BCV69DRAFT_310659 [Microstroma glucosiphilum]|uniref:tRNA-splicing endonuclease subunit Sen54 N-terminal domain-containing protein n=1 Tax=Pseudomicrostroma glucosiphilum TaxID=1684307 RepID=A0A316UGX1_9BASI|nr:hypothetical protein BCV69DRAFT_310659 [Pseudomicrostroma glucosiphilum]PWN23183.1 hypothetical protein BCV69DRAFT_310659 [Pseudomicrostroma glucosiphilum]
MAESLPKAKKQGKLPPAPSSAKLDDKAEESMMAEGDGGAPSDDSDDEVADFRNLLPQLLADKGASAGSDNGIQSISIPKRGEKDFEPTGFRGQERKLEESRRAMEMVISQSRRCGSKTLSTAIWRPDLNRAIVQVSRGTTIASMGVTARTPLTVSSPDDLPSTSSDVIGPNNQVGVWKAGIFYPRSVTRTELLPEEALFLIERGTLDCTTSIRLQDSEEEVQIPLSLQHAFSLMLGKDGCTRERYQAYAYLKRLGYYVQRASVAESLKEAAAAARKRELLGTDHDIATPQDRKPSSQGVIADPKRPLKLVTLWDLLLYIPRRLAQVGTTVSSAMIAWLKSVASKASRTLWGGGLGSRPSYTTRGRGLLGLGGQQLADYDSIFSALQIIPSGHDLPTPHARSSQPSDPRFQPFFYAWRPATRFRKTNPPLPEYRIAAISARDSSLPKLHEFQSMFESVPLERDASARVAGEGGGEVDEAEEEERIRAAAEKKRNDESYGRGFLAKKRKEEIMAARAAKRSGQPGIGSSALGSWLRERLESYLPPRVLSAADNLLSGTSSLLLALAKAFSHLPPGNSRSSPFNNRRRQGPPRPHFQQSQHRRPNPFPALKAGRRDVILAVTDHGTTSMLRFGEAEFEKWRLMGAPN